ncbi:hypothetical protein L7F22_060454 [Adiantum nelumboides]|nr:hypothetical protein [Adiantum nelumboides]
MTEEQKEQEKDDVTAKKGEQKKSEGQENLQETETEDCTNAHKLDFLSHLIDVSKVTMLAHCVAVDLDGIVRITLLPTLAPIPIHYTHTPSVSSVAPSNVVDDTFESTPTNVDVANKARKRTNVYNVGIKEATRDIASAHEAVEDAKNVRHKQMLDFKRTKLEIGLCFAMGIEGLFDALNKIADKM